MQYKVVKVKEDRNKCLVCNHKLHFNYYKVIHKYNEKEKIQHKQENGGDYCEKCYKKIPPVEPSFSFCSEKCATFYILNEI